MTTLNEKSTQKPWLPEWLPVFVGLVILYVPTFIRLAGGLWRNEDHVYGYLILLAVLWSFWVLAPRLARVPPQPQTLLGSVALLLGLVVYIVGRSQSDLLLEVGSQVPVVVGILLLMRGFAMVRVAWFSLIFMLFLVPLPGVVVDGMTSPLKEFVSRVIEHVLYAAGYPIARTGVTLMVGQYQLLVADACSGLRSIFSMSALGLIYLFAMGYKSIWRNVILAGSIIPIAIVVNLLRVLILVLITYHFGDDAGQGFLHAATGIVLMAAALIFLFVLDAIIALVSRRQHAASASL